MLTGESGKAGLTVWRIVSNWKYGIEAGNVDRFCPLSIYGLTVFLRSRVTADMPSRV